MGRGYVAHDAVVMERLVDMLQQRQMTPSELFDAVDADGSGEIDLQELRNMVA